MGLDTTHDCWHGAYSAFMRWRQEVAAAAGLPPLELMEGFYVATGGDYLRNLDARLPIKWDCLKPSPLHELLQHSDCDGEIPASSCAPIADALEQLLPLLPGGEGGGHIGNWRDKTQRFIDGLRLASSANEPVEFH